VIAAMRLRLASYNIRKALGTDGRRDPGRILDILNGLDADVVALQEADRRFGGRPAALDPRLIERASDFQIAAVQGSPLSLGFHGNALLVRRGLRVVETVRIDLPGLEPRGAVLAEIVAARGPPMTVIGTHLGLLRTWRRRQATVLAGWLADRAPAAALLGDFNEWARLGGLAPLAARHRIVAPGASFHAVRPVAKLDRVALGSGLALQGAGVVETGKARLASDHLPVWVDVTLAD
jgi:endonuclease/exonuclease/phosphatase family metal-dependent hydrolase